MASVDNIINDLKTRLNFINSMLNDKTNVLSSEDITNYEIKKRELERLLEDPITVEKIDRFFKLDPIDADRKPIKNTGGIKRKGK